MTNPRQTAELIPFEQVQRLVNERRRKAAAVRGEDHADLITGVRTSQVRRLLQVQRRGASPSGPTAA
jgi:hypothetical protein